MKVNPCFRLISFDQSINKRSALLREKYVIEFETSFCMRGIIKAVHRHEAFSRPGQIHLFLLTYRVPEKLQITPGSLGFLWRELAHVHYIYFYTIFQLQFKICYPNYYRYL